MTLVGRPNKNRIAASHDVLRIRTGSLLSLRLHTSSRHRLASTGAVPSAACSKG